jgi:hypothetical protein
VSHWSLTSVSADSRMTWYEVTKVCVFVVCMHWDVV